MKLQEYLVLGMFCAIAIVINIVESFIPLGIPGMRLGFANIVTMITLILFGMKKATIVTVIRVLLVGILRQGLFSPGFFMSVAGSSMSLIIMFLLMKSKIFSYIFISVIGSIVHVIGQLLIAILMLENFYILYYLPILGIASIVTGIVVGVLSTKLVEYDIFQRYVPKHYVK